MLTSSQLRAARAALGWSLEELADASGFTRQTIARLEATDGVPSANARTLQGIESCLQSAGIEFIGSPDDRPGIRIGPPKSQPPDPSDSDPAP